MSSWNGPLVDLVLSFSLSLLVYILFKKYAKHKRSFIQVNVSHISMCSGSQYQIKRNASVHCFSMASGFYLLNRVKLLFLQFLHTVKDGVVMACKIEQPLWFCNWYLWPVVKQVIFLATQCTSCGIYRKKKWSTVVLTMLWYSLGSQL